MITDPATQDETARNQTRAGLLTEQILCQPKSQQQMVDQRSVEDCKSPTIDYLA
jgi:hypothetical protein